MGDDAPTEAPGAADATLPLGPGMKPGNPQATGGAPMQVGPYELIEMLGRGGMGTVWKARHTKLDKLVALKLLPSHLMSDADAVSRFEREMKAVGRLEHAHIVRAMDAGQAEGVHYLVMEYIEGVDLARLVKHRGPRKLSEACQMIRHAALGLAHAHEHGLVHRDIKPSNLLLSKKGLVKILDLGLARLQSERAISEASLTAQGDMMGTPDYMAPEQWQSAHTAGPPADLYALGCTLYHLLIGHAPFSDPEHSTYGQKMTAHLLEPVPPLRRLRPEVPEEVEALCQKLLAKDAGERLASAKQLADELRSLIKSWSPSPAPPELIPWTPLVVSSAGAQVLKAKRIASARWRAIVVAVGAAVLSIVLLAAAMIWGTHGPGDKSAEPEAEQSAQKTPPSTAPRTTEAQPSIAIAPAEVAPRPAPVEASASKPPSRTEGQPPLATSPFDADVARSFQESWARFLEVPVTHTNSLGMKLCLIPPGEYKRGTPAENVETLIQAYRKSKESNPVNAFWSALSESGIRGEAPRHQVRIEKPFYLAACEVTQGQFEQLMKQNRAYFGPDGAGGETVDRLERADLPMENITFDEMVEFCRRLGEQESMGVASRGSAPGGYRLPTDAEWEFACRAGTTGRYWFDWPRQDLATMIRCNQVTPIPVGRGKPNPFGLHDMHGNIGELCSDYFAEDDFARFKSSAAKSPTGPDAGTARVARGGSFRSPEVQCRSSSRCPIPGPAAYVGFRPALSVEAVQAAFAKP